MAVSLRTVLYIFLIFLFNTEKFVDLNKAFFPKKNEGKKFRRLKQKWREGTGNKTK